MKKEDFAEKLLDNGFILEEEWSDKKLGITLYHNAELKSPIYLIDKFDLDSKAKEDEKIVDGIINKINEFGKTIRYKKRIMGVIFDTGSTNSLKLFCDMYFFFKIPTDIVDIEYIPVKKKDIKIQILKDARTNDIEHNFELTVYKEATENLIDVLKFIEKSEESEIKILTPIGLSNVANYLIYFLQNYYEVEVKHLQ